MRPRAKKWLVVADWALWELAIREGFGVLVARPLDIVGRDSARRK
jgi:hypothetical protein